MTQIADVEIQQPDAVPRSVEAPASLGTTARSQPGPGSQQSISLYELAPVPTERSRGAGRWWSLARPAACFLILFVGLLFATAMLFVRVVGVLAATNFLQAGERGFSFELLFKALGIVALTQLPVALAMVGFLLSTRAVRPRMNLTEPDGVAARLPAGLRLEPALQAATAVKLWRCEQEQSGIHKERFGAQASIYGVLTSLLLVLATAVAVNYWSPAHRTRAWEGAFLLSTAAMSAVVVGFGRDFGRMLARVARRDISASMMAMASRNVLLALVLLGGSELAGLHPVVISILAGALAAIFGERVMELITHRLALLFGFNLESRNAALALSEIDGLGPEDAARLSEEGIDSVHALAFASTARRSNVVGRET
jgi:hypothetical protein